MDTRIAIIGGGPGGLLTAYSLRQKLRGEFEATIFEAGSRLGGKIRSPQFTTAPVGYEAGAAELYDYSETGHDPLLEMVKEFGLATRPMEGRTVIMNDLVLKNEEDIRLHLGEGTVQALREFGQRARQWHSPQEYYDSDWKEGSEHPLSKQRFDELLATVKDEAARKFIRISVHSDLATEPHQTSAMYGLQNYLMNEPGYMRLYSIDGGIERLTHELAERVGARILLNHRVTRVARTDEGMYELLGRSHGQIWEDEFDYVVAALPNNWLPAIDWAGPKLAEAMHRHHVHYDYPAHYLRVSLLFQKPFWRDQIAGSYFMSDAFEGCCVYDETSRNNIAGGDGTLFGVLGWLVAGESALTLSNLDDSALIERAMDSLPTCLHHGRELFLEGKVHRWVGSVNGWPAGYPAREPESRHLPEPVEHPELFVVGDYLFDSTLNGVFDSAETVADWIAEDIAEEANLAATAAETAETAEAGETADYAADDLSVGIAEE